jgi:predicted peptidase
MAIDDVIDQFEPRFNVHSVGPERSEPFGYRLLKPLEMSPGKRFPLVVFLHGRDQRGRDNRAQLKFLPEWMAMDENRRRYPCYLLAPQCRDDAFWVESPRGIPGAARPPASLQMQAVMSAIDDVTRNFPVDLARQYLTGLSMGGYATWELGTRLAERWAAVAPICGGGDDLYADRLSEVPVWAWHGTADDEVPVRKTQRMIAALRAAGGHPRYTELEGAGHDVWTQAYRDADGVVAWMFEQRRS